MAGLVFLVLSLQFDFLQFVLSALQNHLQLFVSDQQHFNLVLLFLNQKLVLFLLELYLPTPLLELHLDLFIVNLHLLNLFFLL